MQSRKAKIECDNLLKTLNAKWGSLQPDDRGASKMELTSFRTKF